MGGLEESRSILWGLLACTCPSRSQTSSRCPPQYPNSHLPPTRILSFYISLEPHCDRDCSWTDRLRHPPLHRRPHPLPLRLLPPRPSEIHHFNAKPIILNTKSIILNTKYIIFLDTSAPSCHYKQSIRKSSGN